MNPAELRLSVHGIGVRVRSDNASILDSVEHDFSFFAAGEMADVLFEIHCRERAPDYDALPVLTSAMATPRNITFRGPDATYIDYRGRALNTYRPEKATCTIDTDDAHLMHEIVYLTILSRVSDLLERRGLHRIHALGLEAGGSGVLIPMPSGGGKTTLAIGILRDRDCGIRLLSEDSPLIRRDGMLLPFPLRIGVAPGTAPPEVDPAMTRLIRRMEYDPKLTIDIGAFDGRICPDPTPATALLLGQRSTGRHASIRPVPRRTAVRHYLMNSVVGVGLYQGMEFIMHRGLRGLASQSRGLLSRLRNNAHLLRRCRVYTFTVGRDPAHNMQVLKEFMQDPGVR